MSIEQIVAPANLRAVVRVSTEFLLRGIDSMVTAEHGSLIGALVFSTIWMNNVRHITQSSANSDYGALGELPPDSLRQPVNVKTVAEQLGMPYETVRRHAVDLIARGECVRAGKRGLIVPAAVLAEPHRLKAVQDSMPNVLRLIADLKRANFDFAPYRKAHAGTVPTPVDGTPPANARAMLRLGMESVMRGIGTMAGLTGGDYLMGLIYAAIWVANVHHVTMGNDNLRFGGQDDAVPDPVRRPVTVNAISASLKLPYETTRRYINELVRSGAAVRTDGRGVIVPADRMMRPDHIEAALKTYNDVSLSVAALHRAGFDFSAY
jgi:hypothetical protein